MLMQRSSKNQKPREYLGGPVENRDKGLKRKNEKNEKTNLSVNDVYPS